MVLRDDAQRYWHKVAAQTAVVEAWLLARPRLPLDKRSEAEDVGDGGRDQKPMATDTLSKIRQDFAGEPADLIPVLQRVQESEEYLSANTMRRISRWLKVSENEVYGVSTFYAPFRFIPPGRHHIRACLGTACHVRGASQMLDTLRLNTVDLRFCSLSNPGTSGIGQGTRHLHASRINR